MLPKASPPTVRSLITGPIGTEAAPSRREASTLPSPARWRSANTVPALLVVIASRLLLNRPKAPEVRGARDVPRRGDRAGDRVAGAVTQPAPAEARHADRKHLVDASTFTRFCPFSNDAVIGTSTGVLWPAASTLSLTTSVNARSGLPAKTGSLKSTVNTVSRLTSTVDAGLIASCLRRRAVDRDGHRIAVARDALTRRAGDQRVRAF